MGEGVFDEGTRVAGEPMITSRLSAPPVDEPATTKSVELEFVDIVLAFIHKHGDSVDQDSISRFKKKLLEVRLNLLSTKRSAYDYISPGSSTSYEADKVYSLGDVVYVRGAKFESLQNSNVGNSPSVSPLWWKSTGQTDAATYSSTTAYGLNDVVEHSGVPIYNATTTYGLGDVVTYVGALYKSIKGSNTGNTPGGGSLWWGVSTK